MASDYDELSKRLVHKLKFERAAAASEVISAQIGEVVPLLPESIVVCYIPTASKRVRIRGYDQSRLIADGLSRGRGWSRKALMKRIGSSRQVGSDRKTRLAQMKGAFRVTQAKMPEHVLLVDDVLTTGATVESAAEILKKSGVKTIDAVVFTQPMD